MMRPTASKLGALEHPGKVRKVRQLACDVCVVGSGVAGAIAAHRLTTKFDNILVLERGERTELTRSLELQAAGVPAFPQTRLSENYFTNSGKHVEPYLSVNALGGSTLRWWGHAPRFFPSDFRLHSTYGVGVDWPIDYDDIERYLVQAERELQVAGANIGSPWRRSQPYPQPEHPLSPSEQVLKKLWAQEGVGVSSMPLGRRSLAVDGLPACCGTGVCSTLCPVDGKYTALNTHVRRAEATGRVEFLTGCRANVLSGSADSVNELLAQDQHGGLIRVRADYFMLAGNALENTRILLNSQGSDDAFRAGADVGRYFMDHPNLIAQGVLPLALGRGEGATPSNAASFDFCDGPSRANRAAGMLEFLNAPLQPEQYVRAAMTALQQGRKGRAVRAAVRMATQGWFQMGFQMELLPHADNRVRLSTTQKDPFGWPVLDITFDAWPDYVAQAAQQMTMRVRRLVERHKGRVEFLPRYESRHFIGTHRMGDDPEASVVSAQLQHHHYHNLYLLGSGVFPTASSVSPTLMIAALSLRAADHLLTRYRV